MPIKNEKELVLIKLLKTFKGSPNNKFDSLEEYIDNIVTITPIPSILKPQFLEPDNISCFPFENS